MGIRRLMLGIAYLLLIAGCVIWIWSGDWRYAATGALGFILFAAARPPTSEISKEK